MASILEDGFLQSRMILTTKQLASIGSVAVESTNCEMMVEFVIWSLLRLDEEQGKFITQGIQMKNRLELLLNLAKENFGDADELITEFTGLITQMKAANEKRNIIIHGNWTTQVKNSLALFVNGPEHYPPAIAKKRRLREPSLEFSAELIYATAEEIAALTVRLTSFAIDH